MGTSISFAFYGLLTYFLALCEVEDRSGAAKWVGQDLLIFGSFFGLIFLADRWVPPGSVFVVFFLKALLFLSISAPYLVYMERKEHLFRAIWGIAHNKFSKKK
jgi:hypothetical protein